VSSLILWDKMKQAVVECHNIDEISNIRNQAEAYRYALRQAKESPEVIKKAEEIKLRAERRAGELLKETPKATGNQYSANSKDTSKQKLKDMGISHDQSSKWQKIANIPEEKFENYIEVQKELSTAGVLRVADSEIRRNNKTLAEKFLVPPFSVLDTRRGYWQERKQMWYSLGLQSELGRDTSLTYDREGDEDFVGMAIDNRGGNISVFDPVLSELMYKWFCPDSGTILDPFAGGSTRGVIARYLNYKYTGIELREEQIRANISQAEDIFVENYPDWICGDSNKILDSIDSEYDFVFSCPPYYDLEVYSDLEGELSNHSTYDGFLVEYKEIISKAVSRLKEDRFACFAVGDIRDGDGMYRNFVSDTISAFLDAGMKLYNEMILVTPVGSLPIRINKQFQGYRKVGKTHQNILVFYKGNPKNIKNNFNELEGLGVGIELGR